MRSVELLSPLSEAIIAEASAERVPVTELAFRVGGDARGVDACVRALVEHGVLTLRNQVLSTDIPALDRAIRTFA
jgi:hypothetical protein